MTTKGFASRHKREEYEQAPNRVHISNDSSDSRQSSPSTRDDTNVLVRVLADFSTSVGMVVEVCDGFTKV